MTDLPRENVQSYPRPPALEPVPQRITIRVGGVLVAETTGALRVLEIWPALKKPACHVNRSDPD